MQLLLHRRKCSHRQLCALTASKLVALIGHNENVACAHRIDVVHSVTPSGRVVTSHEHAHDNIGRSEVCQNKNKTNQKN